MATVVGGANIELALDPGELDAAQQALAAIGSGFPDSEIHQSLADPILHPNDLQIFDLPGGGNYDLTGNNEVLTLADDSTSTLPTTITASGQHDLIIGNQGNDTFSLAAGSGSVFAGDGTNTVNLSNDASAFIEFGTGNDTVNMTGGAATINQPDGGTTAVFINGGTNTIDGQTPLYVVIQDGTNDVTMNGGLAKVAGGTNTINLASGDDTVASYGGATSINVTGDNQNIHIYGNNDTVTLGSGDDTVVLSGDATAFAGAGNQQITAIAGNDLLVGGSGNSTMTGGFGSDTFAGGSGHDVFVAGSEANLFSFSSDSAAGGTHIIQGFTEGRDQIALVGYDTAAALANAHLVGGDTVINLDGGSTTITLTNFTHLTDSDFKQ